MPLVTNAEADRISYQTWQVVQAHVESPLDDTPAFWRYVISAYPYYRSRLFAPGRAYDTEEDGMLAIGGSAHCDVMDLDVKLHGMSAQARRTAVTWMMDSSPDDVAYWRKLGRGISTRTEYRRRNDLLDRLAQESRAA